MFRKYGKCLCALFLVISNISGFDRLKYIGLLIILGYVIFGLFKDGIERGNCIYIVIFLVMAFTMTVFQELSMSQIINAVVFAMTLLLLSMYGNYFFSEIDEVKYFYVGTAIGIIFGLFYNIPLLLQQIAGIGSRHRVYGSFYHPNSLGALATMAIAMLIIMWVWYKRKEQNRLSLRLFYLINMAVLFVLVYFTDSRGYMILAISFLAIFALKKITAFPDQIKPFVYVVLFAGIIYIGWFFYTYYASTDLSYSSRIDGLMSINLQGLHKLIGYGMVSSDQIDYSVLDAGSMEIAWVKLYYKGGIIYIVMYIFLFLNGTRIVEADKRYAFYSVFFAFLLGSLVESSIVTIFNANPIFMYTCLSALPFLRDKGEETNDIEEYLE